MDSKAHLIALFEYQDIANRKMLPKIAEMPDPAESIRLISHLIHSQDKWIARLNHEPDANKMEWFGRSFTMSEIEGEWARSVQAWIDYLNSKTEEEILAPVQWIGFDGATWEARLYDLAMQLNFHGVHHRAQIQTLVRAQGLEPDFVDYIGTKYRRIG